MTLLLRISLFFSLFLIMSTTTICQEDSHSRYAINIGLGMEKIGMPFREVVDFPIHSSYHVGLERKWSESPAKLGFQSLDISLFTNTSAGSGYTIQTACGTKIRIKKTFYFSPSTGFGIVHLFRPKESFVLEDGSYKENKDKGKICPLVLVNFKLAYQKNRIGLFGAYQIGLQYGYGDDMMILPKNFLNFGVIYNL